MKVQILFFGATSAIVGNSRIQIESEDTNAQKVLDRILERYPTLASHRLHIAINQEYASGAETVRDGDEIAVFTAVSGG